MLGEVGVDVRIDRTAQLIGAKNIRIGSHVRIDSHCILIGGKGILIGSYIHLAWGCHITATGAPITLEDFTGLSSGVKIFSATDDYTNGYLTNPMVSDDFKNVRSAPVILRRHSIVGANSVIMPGSLLERGVAVGALSYVNKVVPEFSIIGGNPPRLIGKRNGDRLLDLEKEFLDAQR
jgi:galactoside O-acetyltransferase